MPDTVALSKNISDIALWVKKSKMVAICPRSNINRYHFRHKKDRFVFFVSIMVLDIVMLSENILDIALWV